MDADLAALPDDIEALKAALLVARAEVASAQAEAAEAKARVSDDQALIAHLKLQIQKLNRERFGPGSVGNIPPAEAEVAYYAALMPSAMAA